MLCGAENGTNHLCYERQRWQHHAVETLSFSSDKGSCSEFTGRWMKPDKGWSWDSSYKRRIAIINIQPKLQWDGLDQSILCKNGQVEVQT